MRQPETIVIEVLGGLVYYTQDQLAKKYGRTKATIRKYTKELEAEVGKRYSKRDKVTITRGNIKLINEFAWLDFLDVYDDLQEKATRKLLDPYEPEIWRRNTGHTARQIRRAAH